VISWIDSVRPTTGRNTRLDETLKTGV
jgi:hypothetical protein